MLREVGVVVMVVFGVVDVGVIIVVVLSRIDCGVVAVVGDVALSFV